MGGASRMVCNSGPGQSGMINLWESAFPGPTGAVGMAMVALSGSSTGRMMNPKNRATDRCCSSVQAASSSRNSRNRADQSVAMVWQGCVLKGEHRYTESVRPTTGFVRCREASGICFIIVARTDC